MHGFGRLGGFRIFGGGFLSGFALSFLGFLIWNLLHEQLSVDGLYFGREGGVGLGGTGIGRNFGRHGDDFQGGAQAQGGGGAFVVQDGAEDFDGFFSETGGMVVPEESAFACGEFEFAGEGGDNTAPIGHGVAVDAGGVGGCVDGRALREQAEDVVLSGRQRGIGRILGCGLHFGSPGGGSRFQGMGGAGRVLLKGGVK